LTAVFPLHQLERERVWFRMPRYQKPFDFLRLDRSSSVFIGVHLWFN